jgi:hypothetical protein
MSKLYVNQIVEANAGAGVHIPGHVVQVQTYSSSSASISTGSSSYVSSGLSCGFTPKYNNSLLKVELKSRRCNLVDGKKMQIAMSRDSGATFIGSDMGFSSHKEIYFANSDSSASNQISVGLYFPWYDEPNTTSSLTYTVWFKNDYGSGTVYLSDSGGIQVHITEIAQ